MQKELSAGWPCEVAQLRRYKVNRLVDKTRIGECRDNLVAMSISVAPKFRAAAHCNTVDWNCDSGDVSRATLFIILMAHPNMWDWFTYDAYGACTSDVRNPL